MSHWSLDPRHAVRVWRGAQDAHFRRIAAEQKAREEHQLRVMELRRADALSAALEDMRNDLAAMEEHSAACEAERDRLRQRVHDVATRSDREKAKLQSQVDNFKNDLARARQWADRHLECDWSKDEGATWWGHGSTNNRFQLVHMTRRLAASQKALRQLLNASTAADTRKAERAAEAALTVDTHKHIMVKGRCFCGAHAPVPVRSDPAA